MLHVGYFFINFKTLSNFKKIYFRADNKHADKIKAYFGGVWVKSTATRSVNDYSKPLACGCCYDKMDVTFDIVVRVHPTDDISPSKFTKLLKKFKWRAGDD